MTDKDQNPDTRINMMDTPFPMRGDLPKREPGWVSEWNDGGSCCTTARLMPTASCTSATR
jgi:isoleucyl-tRNA synthetase